MKSRAQLVALVVTLCIAVLATPAVAVSPTLTGPVVTVVAASQFDSGLFVALVTAYGPADIIDAQLVVNNTTPVVPAKVESYEAPGSKNATLFKIISYTQVVQPGDTLTAIVTDTAAAHATRTAVCGRGIPLLHIASLCK